MLKNLKSKSDTLQKDNTELTNTLKSQSEELSCERLKAQTLEKVILADCTFQMGHFNQKFSIDC